MFKTTRMVLNMMSKSRRSDHVSMYSRSSSIILWNVVLLRPFTCQRPVQPGVTVKRRFCSVVYSATSLGSGGRGPTRLISPRRTLKSWGNSSRLVFRRMRPIFVILGSLTILNVIPSLTSFMVLRDSSRASASVTIERNLYIQNSRPSSPTRFCLNNAGPGESNFTRRAINSRRGLRSSNPSPAAVKSKMRFVVPRIPWREGWGAMAGVRTTWDWFKGIDSVDNSLLRTESSR